MKRILITLILFATFISLASAITWNNIDYWRFDEGAGTSAADAIGPYPITVNNSWGNAKLGSSAISVIGMNPTIALDFKGSAGITINFWVNRTGNFPQYSAFFYDENNTNPTSNGEFNILSDNNHAIKMDLADSAATPFIESLPSLPENRWTMITIRINNTYAAIYYNGTLMGSTVLNNFIFNGYNTGFFRTPGVNQFIQNATVDEFGIWNRTLSSTEISDLYNNGAGVAYPGSLGVKINYPTGLIPYGANGQNLSLNFTITNSSNPINLCWYSYNNANKTLTQCPLNSTFLLADYSQTSLTLFANVSTGAIAFNTTSWNYTLFQNNVTYTASVNEATNQPFGLNLTYDNSTYYISAVLNYNGTNYTTTTSNSGVLSISNRTLLIPNVNQSLNFTFNWIVTLTNIANSTVTTFTSPSYTQQVINLGIDGCGSFSQRLLNATLYHETTRVRINGTIEGLIEVYPVNSNSMITSYNGSVTNSTFIACIDPAFMTANYTMNYQFRYYNTDFFTEFVYGRNISLVNSSLPFIISLYDLLEASGQLYKIIFQDSKLDPYAGVVVNIYRQYVPISEYILVEAPITDTGGEAPAHFVSNDVVYKIIMTKNNRIVSTFDDVRATCSTTYCVIPLNSISSTSGYQDLRTQAGITYYFTNTSGAIQVYFNSIDGNPKNVNWNVWLFNAYQNESLCSGTSNAASGVLNCNIPTQYINSTVIAKVYSNSTFIGQKTFNFGPQGSSVFGGVRVILGILLYTSLTLLFISDPIVMIIGAIFGIVFAALMFLVDSNTSVWSLIIWFVIAAAIIIWRISRTIGEQ